MAFAISRCRRPLPLRSLQVLRFSSSESHSTSGVQLEGLEDEHPSSNRALGQVRADNEVVAAGPISGQPDELAVRPVRIYQPAPVRLVLSEAIW